MVEQRITIGVVFIIISSGNALEELVKAVDTVTAVIAGRPDCFMMCFTYSAVCRLSFTDGIADIKLVSRNMG